MYVLGWDCDVACLCWAVASEVWPEVSLIFAHSIAA